MFKAPKYSTLLDPRHIPEGYLRKLFEPCRVTEHDFFLAVTEAHRRYQLAQDKWFRMIMKRFPSTSKGKAPGQVYLEDKIEVLADGVVWLIGGMLGRYDDVNNARALATMQELLRASNKRARREQRATNRSLSTSSGGDALQVPFSVEKTAKRRR